MILAQLKCRRLGQSFYEQQSPDGFGVKTVEEFLSSEREIMHHQDGFEVKTYEPIPKVTKVPRIWAS